MQISVPPKKVNIVLLLFILSLLKCSNVIFMLAYINVLLAEKNMLKLATTKATYDLKGGLLDWYFMLMFMGSSLLQICFIL